MDYIRFFPPMIALHHHPLHFCVQMTRILIGMGQAFNAPACYGLITLYFPDSHRATANGIYSTGTYLGSAVSSLCLTLAGSIGAFFVWRSLAFLEIS